MQENEFEENDSTIIYKTPKKVANKTIEWLHEMSIVNSQYRIQSDEQFTYIPIKKTSNNIIQFAEKNNGILLNVQDSKKYLIESKRVHKPTLKEAIRNVIPNQNFEDIPRAFDIIGDIAILELNREEQIDLMPYSKEIAETLLKIHPNIRVVYEKSSDIEGLYRTRKFSYLAGKEGTETIYRENNCRYKVDIQRVFFTPRLSHERERIANINTPFNEYGILWDMFCGIGSFMIQIAKKYPKLQQIGTDINPKAIQLAEENLKLNKIQDNIIFYHQNIMEIQTNLNFTQYYNQISRIIMNLPERNLEFIKFIPPFLHPKGALLHIYQFNNKQSALEDAENLLRRELEKFDLILTSIENKRIVKPFSPALDTTVIDGIIMKKKN